MERVLLQTLVSLLVSAALGWAQTGTGNIQGIVKDATGAILPGATVTLTHVQTSRQYTTPTTEVGFYLFPSVQLGTYQIAVEAPGMETWKAELTLQVGQTAEVNPVLRVGATATEVTVAGDVTPLVTTANPTLSSVVERARIDQLPLNGRFIQDLLYMTTPGFESGAESAATVWPALRRRNVAGQRGPDEPPVAIDSSPAARTRHYRRVSLRDEQFLGQDEPSRHRNPDDQGRHQPAPWFRL